MLWLHRLSTSGTTHHHPLPAPVTHSPSQPHHGKAKSRSSPAWLGLCLCRQEEVPTAAAHWGHVEWDESQQLWERDTSHSVGNTWLLSHWHLPWPTHSTFFPQDLSKFLRLLILYQDSPAMVWIPNIDLLRRRTIDRFSCSAHARYFATTRKRSRSYSPRCGWEEQLPAEGHVSSKDDVATVVDRVNPCTNEKASVQSLLSRQQGKNRNWPVASNPPHSRPSPTLPTQLLFPQKNLSRFSSLGYYENREIIQTAHRAMPSSPSPHQRISNSSY